MNIDTLLAKTSRKKRLRFELAEYVMDFWMRNRGDIALGRIDGLLIMLEQMRVVTADEAVGLLNFLVRIQLVGDGK